MPKYKLGERFIVDVTKVDDTGMGVTYTLGDMVIVSENALDYLTPYKVDEMPENTQNGNKVKEYTLDELHRRIFAISDILHKTIEAYIQAEAKVKSAVADADKLIGGE